MHKHSMHIVFHNKRGQLKMSREQVKHQNSRWLCLCPRPHWGSI